MLAQCGGVRINKGMNSTCAAVCFGRATSSFEWSFRNLDKETMKFLVSELFVINFDWELNGISSLSDCTSGIGHCCGMCCGEER